MKTGKWEPNRCVLLTDYGLQRFHDARRRYRKTIENIAWDKNTPSVNTVKRASVRAASSVLCRLSGGVRGRKTVAPGAWVSSYLL